MPSHAMTRNSSPASSLHSLISGYAVTIWSLALRFFDCLYSRSPMARESAKEPLTRPSCTNPPAFMILARSSSSIGLWSRESATAVPRRHRTARESPAFATIKSSPRTTATTQVDPAWGPSHGPSASSSSKSMSSPLALARARIAWRILEERSPPFCPPFPSDLPASSLSSSLPEMSSMLMSMARKASMRPCGMSPRLYASHVLKTSWRCRDVYMATSLPPWPSYTPKKAVSSSSPKTVA
mmetsp:Transcript_1081/g.4830  ORF Transcript_1081/g.4830 Transcript_1081/m.4830 type:complete len:240 (+) Transcript_1081:437-1156(+)